MELQQYKQFLQRWLWLIALVAAATGIVAFVVSQQLSPVYAASTSLLVSDGSPRRETPSFEDLRASERLAKTYAELLLKRPVFEGVVANLGLNIDASVLANRVRVELVPDTQLLILTAEAPNAQQAAAIANETVAVFQQQASALLSNPFVTSRDGVRVVEPAQAPTAPERPRPLWNALIAAMVGALLAIGIVFLVDYLDDTIKSRADVTRLTGLATIGAIAPIKGADPHDKLVTITQRHSRDAEAYRMIRAHIELAATDKPISTLTVTSSNPLEGKSVTAANLAIALAQSGVQVILVDMNLHNPTLHTFFRQPNTCGVTTVMEHAAFADIDSALVASGVTNLRLLLSGPSMPDMIQLLGPQHLPHLIDALRERADIVLFDTPSLLTVSDTTFLVRACDATLLVVLAGSTQASTLLRAREHLVQLRTRMVGVMLNRVAPVHDSEYVRSDPGKGYQPDRELPDLRPGSGSISPRASIEVVETTGRLRVTND